jgi:hypothetical protein
VDFQQQIFFPGDKKGGIGGAVVDSHPVVHHLVDNIRNGFDIVVCS